MHNERRKFLKLGTVAAVGSLLDVSARAAGESVAVPAGPGGDALRLATYRPLAGGEPRVGVVTAKGRVVDLAKAAKAAGIRLGFDPANMLSLIAAGPDALALARKCAAADPGEALDSVRLMAPIPLPARNVYAVGWNYLEHFEESLSAQASKAALPKHPVFFTKGTHTINGPFDPIPFDPSVSVKIDWEGELAVIIGKRGRNIAEADALSHVFGYAVINDATARDIQADHGGQWFKGKSLDGHGPIGPWIVAASDIDYNDLELTTRVNGVVKQQSNTRLMYFKVPRIIAELSRGLTLEPGDIIASGTPAGTGGSRTPPEFLKPGDILETEINRIGVIRNQIKQV